MAEKAFHITVGAYDPGALVGAGQLSLEREIEMCKASLLYGDRARLCSPASGLILAFVEFGQTTAKAVPTEKLARVLEIAGSYMRPETRQGLAQYHDLLNKKHKGSRDYHRLKGLEKIINDAAETLLLAARQGAAFARFSELETAQQAGLLDIDTLDYFEQEKGQRTASESFAKHIAAAVEGSTSYPLFDGPVGLFVQMGILRGEFKPSERFVDRGKQAGLAAALMNRLPHFDLANMSEILSIRVELEHPLVRFRSAIMQMSDRLTSIPWTQEFQQDAEQAFRKDIEPAVLEIEEAIQSNKYLRALISRFAVDPQKIVSLPGAAATAVAASLSVLAADHIAFFRVLSAISGLAPAALTAIDVRGEVRKKREEISRSQLFFYYKAKTRLEELHS